MAISEPSLWLFFGRLHPLILHFPVALLILVGVLEVLRKVRWFNTKPDYQPAIFIILLFGCISAIVAATMGWSLASSGGYQGDTIYWHKRFGISVAVLSLLATYFKYLNYKKAKRAFLVPYITTLTLCIAAVFTAGHYGGALTHGSDFLPSAAPEPLASWLREEEVKLNSGKLSFDIFTQKIAPILDQHCYQCHGSGKQQGGLQLNEQNTAFSGGESGLVSIKPGAALESEIIRRLFLPRDNKKAMPPEGKKRPNAEQLVTLMDWIESGAPWAGESAGPRGFLADHLAKNINGKLSKTEQSAIKALKAAEVAVRKVNKNNPLLMVNMSLVHFNNQEIIKLLTPIKHKITWLNLANNPVNEQSIEFIGSLIYLTHLSLANSGLTDHDAKHLLNLTNLTSLNIIGNKTINEKTIKQLLTNLPRLNNLYLWKTAITPAQLAKLQLQYPDIKLAAIKTMRNPTTKAEKLTVEKLVAKDKPKVKTKNTDTANSKAGEK